jgi:dCMP deaminase
VAESLRGAPGEEETSGDVAILKGEPMDSIRSTKWDAYFIEIALLIAKASKDPSTQVGAVIVGPDREIRSTGFNGFPRGIADTVERLGNRDTKLSLIVHGELNAILNAARSGISTKGCDLFIGCRESTALTFWGGPPCTRCTVEIIQAGIIRVISLPKKTAPSRWHKDLTVAEALLAEAGIEYIEVNSLNAELGIGAEPGGK